MSDTKKKVFRGKNLKKDLFAWLEKQGWPGLVGHHFKWDLSRLYLKGIDLREYYHGDSCYAGHLSHSKIPAFWLRRYNKQLKELNKERKKNKENGHRKAGQYSLKTMAPYWLNVTPFWEPADHDDDEYVLLDSEYALRTYRAKRKHLKKEGHWQFYKNHVMPWARMLTDAECAGLEVDVKLLHKIEAEHTARLGKAQRALSKELTKAASVYRRIQADKVRLKYQAKSAATGKDYTANVKKAVDKLPAELNLNSAPQVKWLLKEHLKLPIVNGLGKESTQAAVLNQLAKRHIVPRLLLEVRETTKMLSSFVAPYYELVDDDHVMRCNINLEGARTGRTSSSRPNLQQVPPELRRVFKAREGMQFINFDLSAIEAALIAFYSDDATLTQIIQSKEDFHGYNAVNIYFPGELGCAPDQVKAKFPKRRDFSKRGGYSGFYGAGFNRMLQIAWDEGEPWAEPRCKATVKRFRTIYRDVWAYKKELDEEAEAGRPIFSLYGRSHVYPDPADVYMKAFNTQIQASASDLLLEAALHLHKWLKARDPHAGVRLVVNDEVIAEAPKRLAKQAGEVFVDYVRSIKLKNSHGYIKLDAEGKVGDRWDKD